LNEERFIKSNSDTWRELEELSMKIHKKGIKSLSSTNVKKFLSLFRLSSHHLAYAKTHYPQSNVVMYLNSIIGKSQNYIYTVKKIPLQEIKDYICYGFPKLLKTYRWYILGSFSFFIIGTLLSLILVLYNSDNANIFLDPSLVQGIKSGRSSGNSQWNYPLMSSYIMTNNITVSLKAFVMGITLGIGTIYALFFNGALLGALTALIYSYGDPINYWSLILPHGIIELTAIFISGAAGLIIAKSILIPGEYSRIHSLIKGTKNAVSLLGGIVFMLIIAGIIEGFFTPLNIPAVIKLIFAAVTALILTIYFSLPYIIKK